MENKRNHEIAMYAQKVVDRKADFALGNCATPAKNIMPDEEIDEKLTRASRREQALNACRGAEQNLGPPSSKPPPQNRLRR